MLKKVLAAATIAGALTGGVVLTAGPALAADCPAGTTLQVHVHGNIQGNPVDQDVCSPA
ncbi:MAG: hypothetical protein JWP11_709 [Frankiales bacterium]|nr:hypothetical protein [Frankiales bacterium]